MTHPTLRETWDERINNGMSLHVFGPNRDGWFAVHTDACWLCSEYEGQNRFEMVAINRFHVAAEYFGRAATEYGAVGSQEWNVYITQKIKEFRFCSCTKFLA